MNKLEFLYRMVKLNKEMFSIWTLVTLDNFQDRFVRKEKVIASNI